MKPNPSIAARAALPALMLLALAGCGGDPAQPAARPHDVRTVEVQAADAGGGRSWDGVVEAVRQAALSAQTGGRVVEVRRDVGDRVAAGEVLVRLTAVEQQAGVDAARAQLRAAEAFLAEAESNHQRYLSLADAQYVSKAQLDQVRAARDSARAARDAARAQLANVGQQSDYTVVRAPYAGIVSARRVEPGETVGPGQPLMAMYAPEALRIEVGVPQSDAEAIRANPVAGVRFDDGRRVEATQVTVYPSADPATHSVAVRVQLPALDPAPRPGGTARVAFPAVAGAGHPRVPASALVRRGEVNAVYVLADGRLSLRQLRLGSQAGDQVEVIAGVKAGERIAADPSAALQALVAARKDGD